VLGVESAHLPCRALVFSMMATARHRRGWG